MGRSVFETILGAVVLALAVLFLGFAYSSANLHEVSGYIVSANFPLVDGVKEGTDVKINGVKVGSVQTLRLITQPGANQFLVNVRMTIDPSVELPDDTIAMIATESLLGGKYLSLEPGVDDEMIKTDGTGRIVHTQPPLRLDDLIGQLIYSNKRGDSSASAPPSAAPAATPAPVAPAPSASKPGTAAPVSPAKKP